MNRADARYPLRSVEHLPRFAREEENRNTSKIKLPVEIRCSDIALPVQDDLLDFHLCVFQLSFAMGL